MSNIDIDIYFSQFKTFFKDNPKELLNLIGKGDPDEFFEEVFKTITENSNKGLPIALSDKQIIEIVVKINNTKIKEEYSSDTKNLTIFIKTSYGSFSLN